MAAPDSDGFAKDMEKRVREKLKDKTAQAIADGIWAAGGSTVDGVRRFLAEENRQTIIDAVSSLPENAAASAQPNPSSTTSSSASATTTAPAVVPAVVTMGASVITAAANTATAINTAKIAHNTSDLLGVTRDIRADINTGVKLQHIPKTDIVVGLPDDVTIWLRTRDPTARAASFTSLHEGLQEVRRRRIQAAANEQGGPLQEQDKTLVVLKGTYEIHEALVFDVDGLTVDCEPGTTIKPAPGYGFQSLVRASELFCLRNCVLDGTSFYPEKYEAVIDDEGNIRGDRIREDYRPVACIDLSNVQLRDNVGSKILGMFHNVRVNLMHETSVGGSKDDSSLFRVQGSAGCVQSVLPEDIGRPASSVDSSVWAV